MSSLTIPCVETGMSKMTTYFLLGIAAILILTLVEILESRRRNEFIIEKQACEITRLYQENNALENNAKDMVREYENECA